MHQNIDTSTFLTFYQSRQIYDNDRAGILFEGTGTADNKVDHATVYNNALTGIREMNGAANNWWTQISFHDNVLAGIVKQNAMLAPTIVAANANNGQVTVQGTGSPDPGLLADYLVELYAASGDGEGLQYLGSGYTNGAGTWSITFSGAPGCYTAFQTWSSAFIGARASSTFATTFCAQPTQQGYTVYVPLVVKP